MKYLFTIIFLSPILLSAQGKTSIDLFSAAGYSQQYNSFLRTRDLGLDENYVSVYRLGVGVSHALGSRLSLKTGLQAAQYGFGFRSEVTFTDITGNSVLNGPATLNSITRSNYLEGMVSLRYHFNTPDRWSPFIEAGVNVGYFIDGNIKFEANPDPGGLFTEDQQFGEENTDKTSFVGRVGFGTDYGLTEGLSIYGMAAFQHHLTKQNLNEEAKILPWQATLELGVRVFVGK